MDERREDRDAGVQWPVAADGQQPETPPTPFKGIPQHDCLFTPVHGRVSIKVSSEFNPFR